EDNAVGIWGVGPRVVPRVGGARADWCRMRDVLAPRVALEIARCEELARAVRSGEPVLTRETRRDVGPRPPTALEEHDEEAVTLAAQHIGLGDAVESFEKKARDVADRFLPLESDASLLADRRVASVGADHERR